MVNGRGTKYHLAVRVGSNNVVSKNGNVDSLDSNVDSLDSNVDSSKGNINIIIDESELSEEARFF